MLKRAFSVATKVPTGKTHRVFNQAKPFVNVDLLNSDPSLVRALKHFNVSDKDFKMLQEYGTKCSSESIQDAARLAEKNRPTLRQFDNYGNRVDVIDYHPAYHTLMTNSLEAGVAGYGYNNPYDGSFVTRAALEYLNVQVYRFNNFTGNNFNNYHVAMTTN